jgi:hypothetical protein
VRKRIIVCLSQAKVDEVGKALKEACGPYRAAGGVQLDHEYVILANGNCAKTGAPHLHVLRSKVTSSVGVARCVQSNGRSQVTTGASKARGPYRAARGVQFDHEDVSAANRPKRGASHRHVSSKRTSGVGVV